MGFLRITLAAAALLSAGPALAHTGAGAVHGFAAGFAHPMLGFDHLLAMVAVGLWAALVGGRALWAWPLAFTGVMVVGAGLGFAPLGLPHLELSIGVSVVLLGLAAAFQLSLPVLAGAGLCGFFALFHGYAHGAEIPVEAGASAYVAGFTLATMMLHAAGLVVGSAMIRVDRVWLPGLSGAAVATAGIVLLVA
ncbi:MAG: HupE/UreJ family protein [Pseudomonadota bacterium]|nr:HupE/UreJ family protein [Pseudomonadota bacterium]